MSFPSFVKIVKRKGRFVLVATENLHGGQWVGNATVSHPHPICHPMWTPLGSLLVQSKRPNCTTQDVMIAGGWDWGLRFEAVWFKHVIVGGEHRKPGVIKKGQVLRIPVLQNFVNWEWDTGWQWPKDSPEALGNKPQPILK